jgi:hypothetical protein
VTKKKTFVNLLFFKHYDLTPFASKDGGKRALNPMISNTHRVPSGTSVSVW